MDMLKKIVTLPPVRRLMLSAAQRRAGQFLEQDPVASQRRIYAELIKAAADTQFGKEYGFSRLVGLPFEDAYAGYRDRVPIRTYQDFWNDYFKNNQNELADGRKTLRLNNVTWPGRIELFCETSGTTAPTKFIPFSNQMFEENRRAALGLVCCYLKEHPDSGILNGKILYMSGSTTLTDMEQCVYSGDMSAITLRFRPWYLASFIEPSPQVSALPWDDKLQAMAELLINDPAIRVISGVPPWILLLLKRCQELSEGKTLRQALPHLELIIHGGTSIKPYQAEFTALFGDKLPNFIELLPSSEAFMGFQCAGEASMRLTPYYGVFFEFVCFEDLDDQGKPAPFAKTVPLEQVETGQRYAVILNTCSGLWRYHIGDTIRFTNLDPYFIEFTGRDRFLDKLEEKVTQEEVEQVVACLNNTDGCAVNEFIVGTDIQNRRHVWILAGMDEHTHRQAEIAEHIDSHLCELNADYATFRQQQRIRSPEVVMVSQDLIYDWSKTVRGKLGGQTKIPHIDPTLDASVAMSIKEYNAAIQA